MSLRSLVITALLTSTAMFAQEGPSDDKNTGSGISAAEKSFISEAAAASLTEVELGKIAAERATDPTIKSFGQKMVTDHAKINTQLQDLAKQKGAAIPVGKGGGKAETTLSKLTGSDFDRAYAKQMVQDHEKAVALFEKHQNASDPDVKNFVIMTLPMLKAHLEEAKTLTSGTGG